MTEPAVRSAAPLRLSFVGGGTDFPQWYEEHGGAVLSAAIDHFVRVDLNPRRDRQVRVRSADLGHLVEYHLDEGPEFDGVMDLAKATIARIGVEVGIDVEISSEAPPGSGLGGSSALVVAMIAALAALLGRTMGAYELAELAYEVERKDMGISGGWQDQFASVFGGCNLIEFSGEGVSITPVGSNRTLEALRDRSILCYSGSVRRDVGLIDAQLGMAASGREETLLGMKQLHEMAYLMRDALDGGRLDELGGMLGDAFEAKKRMNPHIAEGTPIEKMFEAARAAGARGGKICGAGGGGYLLIYCEPERRSAVTEALRTMGGQIAPFSFFEYGVRATVDGRSWSPIRP